jgi:peptide/nickel transport system substrate-binding protein
MRTIPTVDPEVRARKASMGRLHGRVLTSVLALCAIAAAGTQPATAASSTVTVGATLAPPSLDLTTNAAAAIPEVLLYNVYEGLVKLDPEGKVAPLLAQSWTVSGTGLVYTFTLQKGVRFQNGDALSAQDVVFSFERVLAPASTHPHKDDMAPVKTIKAVGPNTVRVTLKHRSHGWLYAMAGPAGVILDPKAISTIATHPVGTGPYSFASMNTGYSVTLTKNPTYWGTPAGLDKVVFRYYEDPNSLVNAELTGDVDIIDNVQAPELMKQFSDTKRYTVVQGLTNGKVVLSINNSRTPLNKLAVRRAISYAIDRKALIRTAYAGYGKLIGTHSSPSDPWYLDLSKAYPYDPAKAKQLLAQAGYPHGFSLTLQLPPPGYARAGGVFVASELSQVGIKVKIQDVEWPLWLSQVFGNANYDLTIVAHVEPRDLLKYADPKYYWRYDNKTVQRLIAAGDAAPTNSEWLGDYREVERIITRDAVNDWLFLLPNLEVVRAGITGYPTNGLSLSFDVTALQRN